MDARELTKKVTEQDNKIFILEKKVEYLTQELEIKTGQILVDEEVVQTYPDNDGGRWYYNKNGEEVHIYD